MVELDRPQETIAQLSAQEFDALMEAAAPVFPWALGVSGGGDSMALMVLCAEWASRRNKPLPFILTVDHGLRTESAGEAQAVGQWAQAHGLSHHILLWTGAKPVAGVQAAARQARYHLMGQWCVQHDVRTLLTAHNQDDQAETLLLRLGRGSGVDGLSAMAPHGELPLSDPQFKDIVLLRPLLTIRRDRLRAVLEARRQPWIEDPSNDDDQYARVRIRKAMKLLAGDGIETERLAETARRMGRVRLALESAARVVGTKITSFDNAGFVRLDGQGLAAASEELGLRVLSHVLMAVSGSVYPPRLSALERLYEGLCTSLDGSAWLGRGRTLAGCRIVPESRSKSGGGTYLVVREMRALSARPGIHLGSQEVGCWVEGAGLNKPLLWDNRFSLEITLASSVEPELLVAEIRPLGQEGWRQVSQDLKNSQKFAPGAGVPALVRPSLPALWVEGQVAAAPHFNHIRHDLFPSSQTPVRVAARFIRGWDEKGQAQGAS